MGGQTKVCSAVILPAAACNSMHVIARACLTVHPSKCRL